MKPLYFRLAIKIAVGVSLPLAPMFLGHLYVQLDILQSDESQADSCHIVTSSVHSTILQYLLYKRCAKNLLECRPFRFAKDKYQLCSQVITDFCGRFESDFPLAFRQVGLKPIEHSAIESFDQGVGFSWRAYRKLGTGYTCVDFTMGLFVDTTRTTTPLTGFDEVGITYLAATNAGWLPYLANEGMKFVHYPAKWVRRQFGLDQDIPDSISILMESPTSVQPFLQPIAFEFWSQRFTTVTILGSLREGLCTHAMHGYWQTVMTSFEKELMGSHGFSLVPPNGLSTIISSNPRLLFPFKSMLAYARKQSQSTIFEWDEEKKGWHWHAGDYPLGWEKKVKMTNISMSSKKGLAKLKSTSKSKPATPWPSTDAPPSSRTQGSNRKTISHPTFATERRVSYL